MIIYKYDIPDELVYRYCKIIIELEKHYSIIFEKACSEVHNEIFTIAGRSRALDERDDRLFNIALNNMVLDLLIRNIIKAKLKETGSGDTYKEYIDVLKNIVKKFFDEEE